MGRFMTRADNLLPARIMKELRLQPEHTLANISRSLCRVINQETVKGLWRESLASRDYYYNGETHCIYPGYGGLVFLWSLTFIVWWWIITFSLGTCYCSLHLLYQYDIPIWVVFWRLNIWAQSMLMPMLCQFEFLSFSFLRLTFYGNSHHVTNYQGHRESWGDIDLRGGSIMKARFSWLVSIFKRQNLYSLYRLLLQSYYFFSISVSKDILII